MTSKSITLGEIADFLSAELEGNPELLITDAGTIREGTADWITVANDEKNLREFEESKFVAAVVSRDALISIDSGKSVIRVEKPIEAFAKVVRLFRKMMKPRVPGIHPTATVSPTAIIGEDVSINAGVVIGDDVTIGSGTCILENSVIMDGSSIGSQVIIFPGVVIYDNTRVGNRCILHAGCVLGAYGFGYDSSSGQHELSDQLGYVVLEDEVEIGANACVDRGTFSTTTIGQGTKIDNLVQIGHNCQIGKHNLLCSQVGIAGSSVTGDYVVMGGQVGVADHATIEAQTMIGAQSGVISSLSKGTYFGTPCRDARQSMKESAALAKLPALLKRMKKLEKLLDSQTPATTADDNSQQDAA